MTYPLLQKSQICWHYSFVILHGSKSWTLESQIEGQLMLLNLVVDKIPENAMDNQWNKQMVIKQRSCKFSIEIQTISLKQSTLDKLCENFGFWSRFWCWEEWKKEKKRTTRSKVDELSYTNDGCMVERPEGSYQQIIMGKMYLHGH